MGKHGSSNPPPDLQKLAERHGGYPHITAKAWAEYDAEMADWRERQRTRSAGSPSSETSERSDPEALCICGLAGVYWRPRKGGGRPIWRCEQHRDRWRDYADDAATPTATEFSRGQLGAGPMRARQ